ncbi:hypothetical protein RRSWK_04794 [Rhodopirellula sp. SWK7]|nr:hypothetical protein RRSWK_04794 [Rhodopirellula sp. SWK7]
MKAKATLRSGVRCVFVKSGLLNKPCMEHKLTLPSSRLCELTVPTQRWRQ